ncbi:MAG TPA: FAD-dependent oxidoreductase, partial [Thermodesulfobacteriota bacterium]|nr:FAD-dependent oxidoreductase [Thermodesulfobacteriota bacterium]
MTQYDLAILGGGSAAFAAAIKATDLGAEVAVCEEWVIGGTCLNRGCIPSKNLLKASEVFYYSHHQPFKGIEIPAGSVDFARVIEQKDDLVRELRKEKYLNILRENKKIHYYEGSASFISADQVRLGDRVLKGDKFIIATGASPQVIPFKGIERIDFLNSTTALDLKKLPASMIILGGRLVAVEMAQIYAHFGTRVTILQRSPRIIPEEEEEISQALKGYLEEEGIEVHTGVKVIEVYSSGRQKAVKAEIGGEVREFKGEALLMATGISPNTQALNLKAGGVDVDEKGFVKTDKTMKTSNPKIYAAGDVVGRMPLVTVAAMEGAIAAENALGGGQARKVDYTMTPRAIFTHPNVASVGLTEREAGEKGVKVISRTLEMRHVPKARAIR